MTSVVGAGQPGRTSRRLLAGLTILGFALPAAGYLWFIHRYGVNVPREDQWSDISLIGRSYSGHLSLADLWSAHNDHRIFFPNLLAVFLGRTTHLNLFVEMYLSAILLFVSIGLVIAAYRRRSPSRRWIYYCPVAITMLSFAQYQDTLWGFQIAWYMVIAALALVLLLLDRPTLGWIALVAAIVIAVMGSYSLFQGLIIWPVGLLLLLQRRRGRTVVVAWVTAAVATGLGYFIGLPSPPNRFYVLHHPVTAIKLFFLATGDSFAQSTPFSGDNTVLLLGVLMFLIAGWMVIRYGFRHDELSGRPIGVGLISFGLLFVVSADIGTASVFGAWVGTNSLYAINVLMILVGAYLVVLDWPPFAGSQWRIVVHALVPVAVIGYLGLQVVLGTLNGVSGGRTTHQAASVAADVLVNIDSASKEEVRAAFDCPRIGNRVGLPPWSPWCPDGTLSPASVKVARFHHLALFGTAAATSYATRGLVVAPEALIFATTEMNWAEAATGQPMTYAVRVAGSPPPTISSRDLPLWLTLIDNHDGSASLAGTSPATGTAHFVVTAVNRAGRIDVPLYLFMKDPQPPFFTSPDSVTCDLDSPCNVRVRVTGWPTPTVVGTGQLPRGLRFSPTPRGATVSGRVSQSAPGVFPLRLSASTGLGPPAIQTLTLILR